MTTGVSGVVGLVPAAASPRAPAIGGAPPPLLPTGDPGGDTFLDRAVGTLRHAGITRILVGVSDTAGPVGARALRGGGELVLTSPGEGEGEGSLRAAALDMAPGTVVAVLPPAFSLVRPETLAALLAALGYPDIRWPPGVTRVVPTLAAHGNPGADATRVSDAANVSDAAPWLARIPWTPAESADMGEGENPEGGAERLLRVPVSDPGIHVRVDTISAYRRHFPAAYRKRFQKW